MTQTPTSLSGLLRYRSAMERAAWFKLQRANAELARGLEELQQLQNEKDCLGRYRMERIACGVSGAELVLVSSCAIEDAIKKAACSVHQAQADSRAAQDEFRSCRREREVVENAIARQDARLLHEAERRDQARQDDATLRRFSRQKQPFN